MYAAEKKNVPADVARKLIHDARFKDESEFEGWVIKILHANGWLVTSMKDSQGQRWDADAGPPDIIAAHPKMHRLLFAELKMPGKYPTKKQKIWLAALSVIAQGWTFIDVAVWRPVDEEEIIRVAGGKVPLR